MKTRLCISDMIMRRLKREAALSTIGEPSQEKTALPPLPEFRSGGLRVDISDREALYCVMEG